MLRPDNLVFRAPAGRVTENPVVPQAVICHFHISHNSPYLPPKCLVYELLVRSLIIGRRKQRHVILPIVLVLFGVRETHCWWLLFRAASKWPKILHSLCFSFLLSITAVPREIENNAHAKFYGGGGGANEVNYVKMRKWRMGPTWCQKRITGGIRLCCWVPTICFTDEHNLIRRSNNSKWDRASFLKKYHKPQSQNPFGRDKNWKM